MYLLKGYVPFRRAYGWLQSQDHNRIALETAGVVAVVYPEYLQAPQLHTWQIIQGRNGHG